MDRSLRNFLFFLVGFSLVTLSLLASAATEVVSVDYSPDGRLLTVCAIFFAAFMGFRTGYRP